MILQLTCKGIERTNAALAKEQFAPFMSERIVHLGVNTSPVAVKVAQSLCNNGIDPCECKLEAILVEACEILGLESDPAWKGDKEPMTDSRVRRVYSVLKNSTAADLFGKNQVTIKTPAGDLNVPEDAYKISEKIYSDGKNSCAMSREDIHAYASEYFGVKVSKSGEEKGSTRMEARVSRVESVLKDDPALAEKLTESCITMPVRGGGKATHTIEAYNFTRKLVEDGVDVMSICKRDIMQRAIPFFGMGTVSTAPVSMSVPEPAPAPAPAPTPVPMPEPAPLPVQASVPVVKPQVKVSTPITPKREESRLNKKVNFAMSVYTLLIGSIELATLDKTDGSEKRQMELEKIAKEYAKAANVVFP